MIRISSEGQLLGRVTDELTAEGWLWHHCPDSRRCQGAPGFPDVIAVRRGQILIAELKTDTGVVSGTQRWWARELENSSEDVYQLVRPGTLSGFLRRVHDL